MEGVLAGKETLKAAVFRSLARARIRGGPRSVCLNLNYRCVVLSLTCCLKHLIRDGLDAAGLRKRSSQKTIHLDRLVFVNEWFVLLGAMR